VLADPSTEELLGRSGSDNAAVKMAAVKIEPALSHLMDDEGVLSGDREVWTPKLRAVALRLMERAQGRPGMPDGGEQRNAAVDALWTRLNAERVCLSD
jgi:hypothetical protein